MSEKPRPMIRVTVEEISAGGTYSKGVSEQEPTPCEYITALGEIVLVFEQALRAAGYGFDGHLDFAEDDDA